VVADSPAGLRDQFRNPTLVSEYGTGFIFNGCLTLQMYWLGPLLGGILAGLLYDLVFATNASVEKAKAFFTKRDYDDSQFGESSAKIGAVE